MLITCFTAPTIILIFLLLFLLFYLIINDVQINILQKKGKFSERRPKIYGVLEPFVGLFSSHCSMQNELLVMNSNDKKLLIDIKQSGYYLTLQDVRRTQRAGLIVGIILGAFIGIFCMIITKNKSITNTQNKTNIVHNNTNTINASKNITSKKIKKKLSHQRKKYIYPIFFSIIFGCICYRRPQEVVENQAKKRSHAVLSDLPFAIDLLSASMAAGLSFNMSVKKLINTIGRNVLNDEFTIFLNDEELGKTDAEALLSMEERISLPEFTRFAHAIIYAMRNGVPIIDIMKIQVDEMRKVKFFLAQEKLRKTESKLNIPLIVVLACIVIVIICSYALGIYKSSLSGFL